MESITKSKGKMSSKSPIPLSTPIKTLNPNPPPSISDQIPTPEKPIQLPPRTRNRSMALSIKEVKKIAQGLQRTNQSISERSDLLRSDDDDDLLSVEISRPARVKTPIKLIKKYEILSEFFNSMESSIRLLRLKGSPPTFPNICASIQNLTERRFTYGHLAQLKCILPEAIAIKKVLLHDQVTSCMKPDLHISLQVDAIEGTLKGKGDSGYSVLRRVFRERLADFSKRHPEGDDVPEEQLPHPFNQTKQSVTLSESRYSNYPQNITSPSNAQTEREFAVPSHMPRSFKSRFCRKIPIPEAQKTPLLCHNDESPKDDSLVSVAPSPIKCTPKPSLRRKSFLGCHILSPSSSNLRTHEDNISQKELNTLEGTPSKLTTLEATPAKLTSTPARLMAATPEIQTPKRCRPLMDNDDDTAPLKKSAKRSTRTKLFTTPKKNVTKVDGENEAQSSSPVDDVIGFLPESLLQSIREKERKALKEKDAGVPEAKRRQKLIACLPSTFDMILLIFQSGNRSIMTKQELVHKIIANHCKIVDRDEVDEQLKLLQELVPDWFSEKTASTGDVLCSVNKLLSAEELRQRLVAAE